MSRVPKKQVLEIQRVSVSVGDTAIVKNVSLKVRSGEVHVLMGKNGSGKSSLVNALMGHPKYTVTAGEMLLNKVPMLNLTPDAKAKVGIILSMQHLPSVEGITLVYFLHQAYKALYGEGKPIMDFYREAQAKARLVGIPESLLDRPLNAGLSGGEKKQSEIIQLLVLKPKFAFLDEIDSGVDIDALKKVWRGIDILREEGTGFILITHYTKYLQKRELNRIHVMEEGSIVSSGDIDLLKRIERKGFSDMTSQA